MADVVITPDVLSLAPRTVGGGGDVGIIPVTQITPTVSYGPTVGSFASFLGGAVNWLGLASSALGLGAALFPAIAPVAQRIGTFLGQLVSPGGNAPIASVAGAGLGAQPTAASALNPVLVPFDETSLLATSSFQSPAAMGIDPGYSAAPGAQLPVDYTSLYTATPAALGVSSQMITIAGQALVRAFPSLEAVVPKLLTRLPQAAALASAIYATYQGLRAAGQSHAQAKRQANAAHGVRLRRRRMRPTNVRALRRAMRRVRGFQRTARKVGALHLTRRGFAPAARHRRRRFYRRGDISPWAVEDYEDMSDEAMDLEDDGFDPTGFLGEEAVAE
jgi:hypothetical protein